MDPVVLKPLSMPICRVVISNKTVPKASERNLLRRRIRSIMRPHITTHPAQGYTIIVRPEARSMSYRELEKHILTLLTP